MPNTYSWTVSTLDVAPVEAGLSNVVKKAIAVLAASNGAGTTAEQLLNIQLGAVDPENFTPYASLTQLQVVGWIESQLGSTQLDALKAYLDGVISDIVDTPAMAPPWV